MVGRLVTFSARPGEGDALAARLLDVAESVRGTPGCRLYVIGRETADRDRVWVNELWESQADVDAALAALGSEAGRARLAEIMALLSGPPERTDLEPLGGPGLD